MHAASSLGMVLDNKPSSRRAVGPVIKTELGYGDMWKNGLKPNGQRADHHPIRAPFSSLDTVLDTRSSSRRAIRPVKTEPVDDGFPVNVHPAARSIMKTGKAVHHYYLCFLLDASSSTIMFSVQQRTQAII
jgi:hypothetical protein